MANLKICLLSQSDVLHGRPEPSCQVSLKSLIIQFRIVVRGIWKALDIATADKPSLYKIFTCTFLKAANKLAIDFLLI